MGSQAVPPWLPTISHAWQVCHGLRGGVGGALREATTGFCVLCWAQSPWPPTQNGWTRCWCGASVSEAPLQPPLPPLPFPTSRGLWCLMAPLIWGGVTGNCNLLGGLEPIRCPLPHLTSLSAFPSCLVWHNWSLPDCVSLASPNQKGVDCCVYSNSVETGRTMPTR